MTLPPDLQRPDRTACTASGGQPHQEAGRLRVQQLDLLAEAPPREEQANLH